MLLENNIKRAIKIMARLKPSIIQDIGNLGSVP